LFTAQVAVSATGETGRVLPEPHDIRRASVKWVSFEGKSLDVKEITEELI
jgi:hypothetical protein